MAGLKILTTKTFSHYRSTRTLQGIHPGTQRYEGDIDQMEASDGLAEWEDGTASMSATKTDTPQVEAKPANRLLWVVTEREVLHAPENCPFGATRGANAVKHSNLTGGGEAYCGGELVFVCDQTIVVNGCSGRYRVRDEAEMKALASAFKGSGYKVWSMGYNTDVDRPAMFGTQDPEWVAV